MNPPGVAPRVTVVIVTYASQDTVGKALGALRPGFDRGFLRCVVVDNASPDRTADLVAREHPWVELVRSARNLGYGRGCNLGFQRVATPYVLFMNPDVVFDPAEIAKLMEFMDGHPRAGLAGPSTRRGGETFQHSGGLSTPLTHLFQTLWGWRGRRREIRPGDPPERTDWLCGAILLMRRPLFAELRGFDPRFFLYFEETDLCVRVRKAGLELWCVGASTASHAAGSSARKVDPTLREGDCLAVHFFPSRYYYWGKHFGRVTALLVDALDLATRATRDLGRRLLGRPSRGELRTRLRAPLFAGPPWTGEPRPGGPR